MSTEGKTWVDLQLTLRVDFNDKSMGCDGYL